MSVKTWCSKLSLKFKGLTKTKRVLIITALTLLLTVSVAGAVGSWYLKYLGNYEEILIPPDVNWPVYDDEGQPLDVSEAFNENIINIALLGFDRTLVRDRIYAAYRPDTIMVAAVNLETGDVDLVSIPRDSLVPIYNRRGGRDKINHSYYYGWSTSITGLKDPKEKHASGLNSAVQTVSMALQVPIHYWVSIDMDGVAEAVDIMGGVWYDVETNVRAKNGRILIEKGYQKLDGRKYMLYARNRRFSEGDIQRAENQQNILIETFNQFKTANKLIKLPEVYLTMRNNVDTNLNVEQMASLALFATRNISPKTIEQHTVPGNLRYGRISQNSTSSNVYYIIDQAKWTRMIKDIWGVNASQGTQYTLYPPLPKETPGEDSDQDIPDPGPGEEDPGEEDPGEEDPGEGDSGEGEEGS